MGLIMENGEYMSIDKELAYGFTTVSLKRIGCEILLISFLNEKPARRLERLEIGDGADG